MDTSYEEYENLCDRLDEITEGPAMVRRSRFMWEGMEKNVRESVLEALSDKIDAIAIDPNMMTALEKEMIEGEEIEQPEQLDAVTDPSWGVW